MNISIQDARALFTTMIIDVYRERISPTSFLRSFFPSVESVTKTISLEVQRTGEKVAVDVIRGSEGNRNSFGKSTLKQFLPPYFREYFDATDLDLYDVIIGGSMDGSVSSDVFTQFLSEVADKLAILVDTIERAYELQCAQVLQTGIVTLVNGDNIDYKRKALSLVDLTAGNYWANAIDPTISIENGCNFLRQVGKAQGGVINMIAGSTALRDLINNTSFKSRNDLVNMRLDAIAPPQRNSVGATLHGRLTAGSYDVNVWAYNEFYDNSSSVSTPYVNPKNIILLPEKPRFKMAFAAVPRLIKDGGTTPKKGAYLFGEYLDEKNSQHIFDVKSAGVAVPVAVDQIYTAQVVA